MKVLITAGQVYGPLDDNKLVGNRVRGIWATRFAIHLIGLGHDVTLLIADTHMTTLDKGLGKGTMTVVRHHGYQDYRLKCAEFAKTHEAAVMAAAVVNWIPSHPFKGKMPTKGYETGDTINIEFVLAPRVIDEMKVANPKLTLIGCKMLIDSTEDELVTAAYDVLLRAHCNVVIANDMGHGLKRKLLVYQDRSVHEYDDDFEGFFKALVLAIEDRHYSTEWEQTPYPVAASDGVFDTVVEKYRDRFVRRQPDGGDAVFGVLV
jgi:phosphopantothenoylcysteine synthetase/decarboxylase